MANGSTPRTRPAAPRAGRTPPPQRRGAPAGYDSRDYPPFAVTVDVVILTLKHGELHVLLVQRAEEPFGGEWALPGGFKRPDETLDQAAQRELREETGVRARAHLAQLRAYGDPRRDPRMNVVTVAYLAVVRDVGAIEAGTDASSAALVPVSHVRSRQLRLAFDHRRIVADAVEQARKDLEKTSLATAFVGPTFTLSELRGVYEEIWETRLDAANFRRAVLAAEEPFVEATGKRAKPGSEGGRPPELYRPARSSTDSPVKRPRASNRTI